MEVFPHEKILTLLVSVILLVGLVSVGVAATYTPYVMDVNNDNGDDPAVMVMQSKDTSIRADCLFPTDCAAKLHPLSVGFSSSAFWSPSALVFYLPFESISNIFAASGSGIPVSNGTLISLSM